MSNNIMQHLKNKNLIAKLSLAALASAAAVYGGAALCSTSAMATKPESDVAKSEGAAAVASAKSLTENQRLQATKKIFNDLSKACGTDSRSFRTVFSERMKKLEAFYQNGCLKEEVKKAVKDLPEAKVCDCVELEGSKVNLSDHKVICASRGFIRGEDLAQTFPDYYNLFISASQFNLLESVNEYHSNLYDYGRDGTQGPTVCSLSLLGCLKRECQYEEGTGTLGDLLSEDIRKNFSSAYSGGYLNSGCLSKEQAQNLVLSLLKDPAKYGYQDIVADAQYNPAYEKLCRQIFLSAVSYQNTGMGYYSPAISYVALRSQYMNALKDAINAARRNPNKQVALHIPCVGQGAFRNPEGTAQLAFLNAYRQLEGEIDGNLTIFLHGGDRCWKGDFNGRIRNCAENVLANLDEIAGQESLSAEDKAALVAAKEELTAINDSVVGRFVAKRGEGYYERDYSVNRCVLHEAAKSGDVAAIESLLAAGAMVDATDDSRNTALYVAAENGHLDVVKRLLAEGADIDAIYATKKSPLCIAAEKGNVEIVRAMIDAGADSNAQAEVLIKLVRNGKSDALCKLLEVIDPNLTSSSDENKFPLIEAILQWSAKMKQVKAREESSRSADSTRKTTAECDGSESGSEFSSLGEPASGSGSLCSLSRSSSCCSEDESESASFEDYEKILNMLLEKTDINKLWEHSVYRGGRNVSVKQTILSVAAANGNAQLVEKLIGKGARIEANNYEAISEAILAKNKEVVDYLVAKSGVERETLEGLYTSILKELHSSRWEYRNFVDSIPAEYKDLVSNFEESLPKPKSRSKRHGSVSGSDSDSFPGSESGSCFGSCSGSSDSSFR